MNRRFFLFGPSRKAVWEHFAQEIGGEFIVNGWRKDKVVAEHRNWTITLDKHVVSSGNTSTVYTRIRAPYVNKDGFRFTIYRESFFSPLGRKFGMQDVEIGVQPFDDDFVIKGNDEYKLWKLFSNEHIRDLLHGQPRIHLGIQSPADNHWFRKTFEKDVDELQFKVIGIIKDIGILKGLFDLFAETLDQLCTINAAYEHDPDDYKVNRYDDE